MAAAEMPHVVISDVEDSRTGFGAVLRMCKCPTKNFAVLKLFGQALETRVFYPRLYLEASHEVFCFTLIVTWTITLLWFPEQALEHPARPIIGSFNPCFGWDYAPASYIAVVMCSANVYLTWRYAWLAQTRTQLLTGGAHSCTSKFSRIASFHLAVSSNVWLLLWLLGPHEDRPQQESGPTIWHWILHTCFFINYALGSYLAVLGNYLEVRNGVMAGKVETRNTAFIIVYGLVTAYIALVYLYNLFRYEEGMKPAIHPIITQSTDFVWMACLAMIEDFLPKQPPLRVTTEVLQNENGLSPA